jgi:hypothetical protein
MCFNVNEKIPPILFQASTATIINVFFLIFTFIFMLLLLLLLLLLLPPPPEGRAGEAWETSNKVDYFLSLYSSLLLALSL